MTGLEMDFPFTVGVGRALLSVEETEEDIASEAAYDCGWDLASFPPPTSLRGMGFEAVGSSALVSRARGGDMAESVEGLDSGSVGRYWFTPPLGLS